MRLCAFSIFLSAIPASPRSQRAQCLVKNNFTRVSSRHVSFVELQLFLFGSCLRSCRALAPALTDTRAHTDKQGRREKKIWPRPPNYQHRSYFKVTVRSWESHPWSSLEQINETLFDATSTGYQRHAWLGSSLPFIFFFFFLGFGLPKCSISHVIPVLLDELKTWNMASIKS